MAKILIIEDNADLALAVSEMLADLHHDVDSARSGTEGLEKLQYYEYDAVLLDLSLPGIGGLEICKKIRDARKLLPVLIITGEHGMHSKEQLFDAGADDYLTKPFHFRELAARIRALLRRASGNLSNTLKGGDISLDPSSRRVTLRGANVDLLPKEFALLEFFMRHQGEVFTPEALLDHVWSSGSDASPEALRMCIARLRKKIAGADGESSIRTMHGFGYKFEG